MATVNERPDFIEQVTAMVWSIPPGRVMTYGDIAIALTARAERAGLADAYGPRMVGFVLSRFGATMPWWRVIRAGGYPPRSLHAEAWPHYVEEGTPLIGDEDAYRIDMRLARFDPEPPEDGPAW
jgi:alkylated DNA nucleotide flippase Atl1